MRALFLWLCMCVCVCSVCACFCVCACAHLWACTCVYVFVQCAHVAAVTIATHLVASDKTVYGLAVRDVRSLESVSLAEIKVSAELHSLWGLQGRTYIVTFCSF